jgi:hypothetical protein
MQLTIFDNNSLNVAELKQVFAQSSLIKVELVSAMIYTRPPRGLDVLYLPVAAAERWGAKCLVHKSEILPTAIHDQIVGLPPFIVSGTCLSDDDVRGPVPEMKILLSSVFDAVRAFNGQSNAKLRNVGFWGYDLLSNGVSPSELLDILSAAAPELAATGL